MRGRRKGMYFCNFAFSGEVGIERSVFVQVQQLKAMWRRM